MSVHSQAEIRSRNRARKMRKNQNPRIRTNNENRMCRFDAILAGFAPVRHNGTMSGEPQITMLLKAAGEGDSQAAAELLPLVNQQLREVAGARMRKIPPGQTLQPTALVHEAYLRVVGDGESDFENRSHFFFAAARAMRDILVEQARRKSRLKRGGDKQRLSTDNLAVAIDAPAEDMLALHEALVLLEREYPRKHQLIMLRFFAGLTEAAAADIMEVDASTARRDWRFARAWLHRVLKGSATMADSEGENCGDSGDFGDTGGANG